MPKAEAPRPFPLYPLFGAGGLMLISLLSVAWIRWYGEPAPAASATDAVVVARELNFEDLENGRVAVVDATTKRVIRRLEAGEDNFIRATVRGLVRARRAMGAGQAVPFRLELRQSGQVLLTDPVTGQSIDLWAFGATNAQAFASLLEVNSPLFAGATPTTDIVEPHSNGNNDHARTTH